MDLQLVNRELSEVKLYRQSQEFGAFTGQDIADLFYLNNVVLYLLSQTQDQEDYARSYARRTAQFGSYTMFRTHATDIYMLAYQIKYPNNDHARIKNSRSSKKFLQRLNFEERKHIDVMRKIAQGRLLKAQAHDYFMRLEAQLKIKDARFRTYRRLIPRWDKMSEKRKAAELKKIQQDFLRIGSGRGKMSELLMSVNSYVEDHYKTSLTRRAAGAAAGAVVGRYAADKLNKTDSKTAKNLGTGIGAIAGYWGAKK